MHWKPSGVPPVLPGCPWGWTRCEQQPQGLVLRAPFQGGRPGPALTTPHWGGRRGTAEQEHERLDTEGPRDTEQTPHTWPQLPSCAKSLLVSTSTSGWAGGRRAGTVISIHLDCSSATKARRDGDPIPSQTGISALSIWGGLSSLSRVRAQDAGPCLGDRGDSAPAGGAGRDLCPNTCCSPRKQLSAPAHPPPLRWLQRKAMAGIPFVYRTLTF